MFVFKKARSPRETLNALNEYLNGLGDEPVKWLARTVQSWGEVSYAELEELIANGGLNDLIDWQSRWAEVVNDTLAPMWGAAIAAASAKATRGLKVLSDSDELVQGWIKSHGGELITMLSEESRKAVMNIILRGQGLGLSPKQTAKELRPLIGLTTQQAEANVNYRQKVYQRYIDGGASHTVAAARADKAALKYAGKQHRYRAETIVLTENSFAYNRGAHMGVGQAIADGLMGRCEMVWTTAGTNRVCSRCMALKDTVVGHTDESGVTIPPLHPRCRCTIMYQEVGAARALKPKPKPTENYRLITPKLTYKPVSEKRYNQLIIPLKKMGVTIMRGDEETERHLDFTSGEGSSIGKHIVLFRKQVSISTILEETHHIKQNRSGMNDDKDSELREILNEIDAKKYLLNAKTKYGIPREEIEATKIQLKQYEDALRAYNERHDTNYEAHSN